MRFVQRLSKETLKMLQRIEKESQKHEVRQRAKCIQLSYQRYAVAELTKIFNVSYITIIRWLNSWEDEGLVGLYDKKGKGRKQIFNSDQKAMIKAWAKATPKQLDKVKDKIEKAWEIKVSKDTIKRVIKTLQMSWHRVRRVVGGKPEAADYERKRQELERLIQQAELGEIDLRYVDESGFCLIPYVPYAWQEKGEKIEIKSQRSKRLNVIGFLNKFNQLESYVWECAITSDVVVACIDKFSESVVIPTVLVLDQASIHTANNLYEKQEEWQQKGLTLFFLPTYSPHLNLIEILWRFIKYQWLQPSDYDDWNTLVNAVENLLKYFGDKYIINFA